MISILKFGGAPHTSIVIDVYRHPSKVGLCTDEPFTPAEKVVFGINGCELCIKESIAQLIREDPKFAAFVRDIMLLAYPVVMVPVDFYISNANPQSNDNT